MLVSGPPPVFSWPEVHDEHAAHLAGRARRGHGHGHIVDEAAAAEVARGPAGVVPGWPGDEQGAVQRAPGDLGADTAGRRRQRRHRCCDR